MDINTLDARRMLRYQYGQDLLKKFGRHDVSLLPGNIYSMQKYFQTNSYYLLILANSLPKNLSAYSSFKNSFCIDSVNKKIYMRPERFDNVGEFTMVLIHAVAQLNIDPDGKLDEMNPSYITEVQVNIYINLF